jgi:hypothetical protein
LIISSVPSFPLSWGNEGKKIYPSLDLGWTGIQIYKILGYIQSIKLILKTMPTYTINCQMIIRAEKVFKHPFLEALFSLSLSKLIC